MVEKFEAGGWYRYRNHHIVHIIRVMADGTGRCADDITRRPCDFDERVYVSDTPLPEPPLDMQNAIGKMVFLRSGAIVGPVVFDEDHDSEYPYFVNGLELSWDGSGRSYEDIECVEDVIRILDVTPADILGDA